MSYKNPGFYITAKKKGLGRGVYKNQNMFEQLE